jgi:hypothetical protein
MMTWWMTLGEIVGLIHSAGFPVDDELELFDAVANPVGTDLHCLGSALFEGVIDNAFGTFVFCLNGRGWLWMVKLFQGEWEAT